MSSDAEGRKTFHSIKFWAILAGCRWNCFHESADPESAWDRKAIVERMYAVIRCELTEQQHTALLAEFKGMHQNEIARRLGSNGNAVYKLAHDVRKWLKRGMKSADHGAEAIYAVFAN